MRLSESRCVFEPVEPRMLLASISGHLFNDLNNNGVNDSEPPLVGWTVFLDLDHNHARNGADPSTLTNASGDYTFSGLAAANYLVGIVPPEGWLVTYPGTGAFAPAFAKASNHTSPLDDNAVRSAIARAANLSSYTAPQIRASRSWVVGLPQGATIDALAKTVDAIKVTPAGSLPNTYILDFSQRRSGSAIAGRLAVATDVDFFYPLIARQQSSRFIPNDPLFSSQWHLQNTGTNSGGTAGADANVVPAWDNYKGSGVVIGIVDDGLEWTHEDLAANYNAALSYDYYDNDSNPAPDIFDDHGTAVAGIAAARGNNAIGVSGAAPLATLAGIRLTSGGTTDAQESAALSHLTQSIAIYNSSWGPYDDGAHIEGPGPLTLAALASSTSTGRGGLGSIYVWAAGNGKQSNDDVNYDGYANSRYVIAVSAIDRNGVQSYYSEPGAPILVAAYSSSASLGTTTVDRTGSNGYSSGNYTNQFGGTSSASPLAAGVIALMLEANPNLSWRDVQHILVHTARKNHSADSGWVNNGAGLHVSHKYGFGAIDAAAAVTLAQNWTPVAPEQSIASGVLNVNQAIPDNNTTGVSRTFNINSDLRVETVEVTLNVTHSIRGQLKVTLVSPSGTESVLAAVHGDSGANYNDWVFTTKRNWDENARGNWTIKVTDGASGTTGTFNSWKLNVYGTPIDSGVHYVVVNPLDVVTSRNFGAHDIAPPTVASSIFNFEQSQSIEIAFSEDVSASLSASDLVVLNTTTSTTIPAANMSLSYNPLTNTATVTFSGLLPDGNYTATLAAGTISDASGNALTSADPLDFFVLGGDVNRDRTVDITDLSTLATYWQTSGQDYSHADLNYDDIVDISDLAIIATNWQVSLPAPSAPLAMSVKLAASPFLTSTASSTPTRKATAIRAAELVA